MLRKLQRLVVRALCVALGHKDLCLVLVSYDDTSERHIHFCAYCNTRTLDETSNISPMTASLLNDMGMPIAEQKAYMH